MITSTPKNSTLEVPFHLFFISWLYRCLNHLFIRGTEALRLGAHLACFPLPCWHKCKPHSTETLTPQLMEILVPHITCSFYLVTFQLLLFFKETNSKAIISNEHYTKGQKGSTLSRSASGGYDTDQNERNPDDTCGFVLFTYIFWCAVCGMPGVLLP